MKKYFTSDENLEMFFNSFPVLIKEYIKKEIEDEIVQYVNNQNNKEYYSVKEFGEMFGLTKNAVKGRYRRKSLNVCYEGTTPLISKAEVERFKQKLEVQNRLKS